VWENCVFPAVTSVIFPCWVEITVCAKKFACFLCFMLNLLGEVEFLFSPGSGNLIYSIMLSICVVYAVIIYICLS